MFGVGCAPRLRGAMVAGVAAAAVPLVVLPVTAVTPLYGPPRSSRSAPSHDRSQPSTPTATAPST
jgi:hypothetical protein